MLERYRNEDGFFHFFLWYPELWEGYEWTQNSNPVTKTTKGVDGFEVTVLKRFKLKTDPIPNIIL